MGISIVVTSGKGGVGKTSVVANLGGALALCNARVVVVDADIGLRNLDIMMDLEQQVVYDMVDVSQGVCSIRDALLRDPRFPELFLLPASQQGAEKHLEADAFRIMIEELKEDFDYVLIDSPAGIENGFQCAASAADQAIVVTNPDISAIRDADRVVERLAQVNDARPYLIVNRLTPVPAGSGLLTLEQIVSLLQLPLLGIVPDDIGTSAAVMRHLLPVLLEDSPSGLAYLHIASRILGETVPLYKLV